MWALCRELVVALLEGHRDGPARTVAGGAPRCGHQVVRQWFAIDDRIAPLVERDCFGQQFGAVAVRVASHRVNGDADVLHAAAGKRSRLGVLTCAQGTPWACDMTSSRKTVSALRTMATTPSGWRHPPRPLTSSKRRPRRTLRSGSTSPRAKRARSSAMAGS